MWGGWSYVTTLAAYVAVQLVVLRVYCITVSRKKGWYSFKKQLRTEQQRLQKLMEECVIENDCDEANVQYDDRSDQDEEESLEFNDHNSDSEQDISDNEVTTATGSLFIGKDGTSKWNKHSPRKNVRVRCVLKHLPGAKAITKHLKTILDIWQYFIDVDMVHRIVPYTNQHITHQKCSK
ncbi:hypothetical protein FQR65_LT14102 [Abscondita terminalis]|nr:hypothetical protein FQR65_LT14102 [Abscondita terminalis]